MHMVAIVLGYQPPLVSTPLVFIIRVRKCSSRLVFLALLSGQAFAGQES